MSQMHSQQHSQSQEVSLAELVTLDFMFVVAQESSFYHRERLRSSCLQL